jgi:hypothetical protein
LQDVIIIAVSANTFRETKENILTIGCHDFLEKPVSVDELLEKLQVHLKLEWVYDEISDLEFGISDLQSPQFAIRNSQSEIIPPPQEELTVLFELARIGDIINIKKRIDYIEQLDEKFIPFVAEVRRLVKGFEINTLKAFIQPYMEEHHEQ